MMESKKGQVSTELLVLIGGFLIILAAVGYLGWKSNSTLSEIKSYHADMLAASLASQVNSIHNLGTGAESFVKVSVPATVSKIEFRNVGTGGEVVVTTVSGGNESAEIAKPVETHFDNPQSYSFNTSMVVRFKLSATPTGVNVQKQE